MRNSNVDKKNNHDILTPEEVAEELSLKVETIRDLMRRRIIPAALGT